MDGDAPANQQQRGFELSIKIAALSASCALATCVMQVAGAFAADNQAPFVPRPTYKKPVADPHRSAGADSEWASQKLTKAVELTDVPTYSGRAKFLQGFQYAKARNGIGITQTFGLAEEPDQVYQWYTDALKNFKWSATPVKGLSPKDGRTIDASKGGNTCMVQIKQAGRGAPYRTELTLKYQIANQK